MTSRADLIVVGAGLAGSAAAWAAAGRGLSVVVLEAFEAGHRRGSSHGSARIFRRAYPDPFYVRLTGQAGESWRRLEDEAAEQLLQVTGGVDFGRERDPANLRAVLASVGVPAELLAPAEAAQRWPGISFDGVGPVMYQAEAGVLDPDRAMAAMLRLAAARGASVRFGTPAEHIAADGESATVHTASGSFTAPVAVIAAGAWIAPLLDGLVALPPLRVTQQQIFHLPRLDKGRAEQGPASAGAATGAGATMLGDDPWPIFVYKDGADDFYGLPGGRDGVLPGAIKLGEHQNGTVTTAAGRDFAVDPASRARTLAFARSRLPGLAAEPVTEASCLYTRTASEDFILDRQGPLVIASACSGHGAKFAPLLGEILAALAAGKPSPDPRFTLAAHLARCGV